METARIASRFPLARELEKEGAACAVVKFDLKARADCSLFGGHARLRWLPGILATSAPSHADWRSVGAPRQFII
jgi:hypothetical protein